MSDSGRDTSLTNFDLFVLGVSYLSLFNIVLVIAPLGQPSTNIVRIVDGVLCLVFLADFVLRYRRAPDKRRYLVHDKGWLELAGSLPFPGLRIARIYRVIRSSKKAGHAGVRGIWRTFSADLAESALLCTLFLAIIVLQFGSIIMLWAEATDDGSNIRTASDALWWSYVTVTTVGYGDRYPVTNEGRVVGIAMLTIGIGLFGVLTGFITNTLLAPRQSRSNREVESAREMREEIEELRRLVQELGRHVADRDH